MLGEKLSAFYKEIREFLEETDFSIIFDDVTEEEKEFIVRKSLAEVAHAVLSGAVDMEEADNMFIEIMTDMHFAVTEASNRYLFRIKLKGLTKYISRELTIPSMFTLGDLGIAIILAFRGDCSHLFDFTINKQRYTHDCGEGFDYDDKDAFDVQLKDLLLQPKQKFSFCYDFGEDYDFSVEFVKEVKDIGNYPIEVIKGKGYGIYENNHWYLDMYYQDPTQLVDTWEDEQIAIEDILPFDPNDFDCMEINEMLNDLFPMCRDHYCPRKKEETSPYN